ncbi:peptidylprolyl isomerase [Pontibacillus salipaludis]|uniref:Foldase protein PrsA n=1 Tax=Pontibacillus salipaludis TaxID=1697394 RepID=A0ABQ1PRS0_9BACI|nr:peptidylprolyl isomerase [Pontibacillus salipaludis]GGD01572.1 foldase protein PrsA 4 [Pontibacillus salipaludis]
MMKKKVLTFCVATLGALTLSACSNASADGDVVAETANGNITKDEFYNKLVDQYGDAVLKEMLYDTVLSEEYPVSEEEVQAEIDKVKESYGDQFESALQQNGFKDEAQFKDFLKTQLQKEKATTQGVEVTDEEVKEYYENMKQEVQAKHILVEDEETANEVIEKLNNDEDFATLAKEYSTDSSSAENGGNLDYFSTGDMVYPFEQAAYNLEVGNISEPVQSEYGYHIIKVTDKREKEDTSSLGTFDEMKDQLKTELLNRQANTEKLSDIMNNAEININNKDLKEKISF